MALMDELLLEGSELSIKAAKELAAINIQLEEAKKVVPIEPVSTNLQIEVRFNPLLGVPQNYNPNTGQFI